MKKINKILAVTLASVSVVGAFSACREGGGEESFVKDGKTINVRISKSGYGTSYIYKLAEQFEETFKDEGYKVNVLVPLSGMSPTTPRQEIYSDNGTDMYFVGGDDISLGVVGEYGQCYADLTESVFNQKPISFDGTEEDCTVYSKIEGMGYETEYNGKHYGLPYAYSTSGMCVNTKVLKEEFNLEIPRTTNELFHCVETIMSKVGETGVFPITYSLAGNTYLNGFLTAWFSQYEGAEKYSEFWSMQENGTGANLEKPYEVFQMEGLKKAYTEYYRLLDYNIAAFGATTQDFKTSQNQWMNGDAVFYTSGDWAYAEEYIRNKDKLEDVTVVRFPLISALGEKIFGAGTSYNYTAEKCEEILCAIVDGVDANKESSVITQEVNAALAVNLTEADVKTVCERASYTFGNSKRTVAIVSEKSDVKDICALFFRMFASDDGASLVAHEMLSCNPFKLDALSDVDSTWHKSMTARNASRYNIRLDTICTGYRKSMKLSTYTPYTGDKTFQAVLDQGLTIYNDYNYTKVADVSIYKTAAEALVGTIYDNAKTQWENGQWTK